MEIKKIKISLDGKSNLAGMLLSSSNFSGKRPIILVIHGWTSSMSRYPSRVKSLVDMGYMVLLFDMRAHGETGGVMGTFSPHDNLNDCLTAYDFLISLENADLNSISVIGSSYGGYLASLVASRRKVHHLVLSVPALYPNSIFDDSKGIQRSEEAINYRGEYHLANNDFALQAIHEFDGDLLLIKAEKDEVLSPIVMENYKRAAKVNYTYKEIKDSDHSMRTHGANEERIKIQTEWFKRFIKQNSS